MITLNELKEFCTFVETNAANMSESELAKAIKEMNYKTKQFLNK